MVSSIELASQLRDNELGVYAGETANGPTFASRRDAFGVVGGPSSGKSTRVLLQSVAAFPGLVVCTSTRDSESALYPDIVELSYPARAKLAADSGGKVIWISCDEKLTKGNLHQRRWEILDGCSDWVLAKERALLLIWAAIGDGAVENKAFFQNAALNLVAPLMFFCANAPSENSHSFLTRLRRSPVTTVQRDEVSLSSFQDIASHMAGRIGDQHDAVVSLRSFCDPDRMSERTRQNVLSVVDSLIVPAVQAVCVSRSDPMSFDEVLSGTSTIYIQARSGFARSIAPAIAAFIGSLVAEWRSLAATRRPYGLMLALDEVCNIAPIYNLPELVSAGGGDGITTVLGIQDVRRLDQIWGAEGSGIISSSGLLLMPGYRDAEFLANIAALTRRVPRTHQAAEVTRDYGKFSGLSRDQIGERALRFDRMRNRNTGLSRHARLELEALRGRVDDIRNGVPMADRAQTSREWLSGLDESASIRDVTELRHSVEAHELYGMPEATALVMSRGGYGFVSVPGWWESEYWRAVIER